MSLATLDAERLWARLHHTADRHGWVCPPALSTVERAIAPVRAALHGSVLVLGTGGWSFAVDALNSDRVRALDDLDPWVLAHTPPFDGVLAISSSGTTVETRRLAEVFPPTVTLHGRQLSPRGTDDQVALLGAPLSTGFLAPAALAYPDQFAGAYLDLVSAHHRLALQAADVATRVDPELITIAPPEWANEGLRLWLLQLGRQVLCGKSATFAPHVSLVDGPATLDLRGTPSGLSGLMAAMYRAGVFAGCVALRFGVPATEHGNVAVYKRLLGRPARCVAPVTDLPGFAAGWLADRPDLTRLHVVRYGGAPAPLEDAACFDRPTEVHRGSAWNHHSFQAVYADPATAVLLVTHGSDIADATHLALPGRSILVRG